MDDDEVAAALARTDSRDRREIYLAWYAIPKRAEIVPRVVASFAKTRSAAGRASQIHHVTPFARFDAATVALALRALDDRAADVRFRACGLLAHGRCRDALPRLRALATAPAKQAIASITDDKPFAPDDDPFWFLFRENRGRAPWGSFAESVAREVEPFLVEKQFRESYLFAHDLRYRRDDLTLSVSWESYECEADIKLTRDGSNFALSSLTIRNARIAQVADAIRAIDLGPAIN